MARDYRPWTPEEETSLRAWLAHERITAADAAARLDRPIGSVQNKITKLGIGLLQQARTAPAPLVLPAATFTRTVRADDAVQVVAPLETEEESDAAFLARVTGATTKAVQVSDAQRFATLRIASDRPIALSLSSDWHLTPHGACDVAGLLAYADTVADTPSVYAVSVGDLTDNPIKHKGGSTREVPDELRLLDLALGRFRGKMLGMTSGNHDDWSIALAGVDNLKAMSRRHRIHYAPDELVYVVEIVAPHDLETVTARWVVATRHQSLWNSTLNDTHACWRWLERGTNAWPLDAEGRTLLPDVVAIGHNHVASVENKSTPRGNVVACRMGSWQRPSGYARQKGFGMTPPTAPTVILPAVRGPGSHQQAYGFADYRMALTYLDVAARGLPPEAVEQPAVPAVA